MKQLVQWIVVGFVVCLPTTAFSHHEYGGHINGRNVYQTQNTWNNISHRTRRKFYNRLKNTLPHQHIQINGRDNNHQRIRINGFTDEHGRLYINPVSRDAHGNYHY